MHCNRSLDARPRTEGRRAPVPMPRGANRSGSEEKVDKPRTQKQTEPLGCCLTDRGSAAAARTPPYHRPEGGREASTGPAAERLTAPHATARGRQLQPLVRQHRTPQRTLPLGWGGDPACTAKTTERTPAQRSASSKPEDAAKAPMPCKPAGLLPLHRTWGPMRTASGGPRRRRRACWKRARGE